MEMSAGVLAILSTLSPCDCYIHATHYTLHHSVACLGLRGAVELQVGERADSDSDAIAWVSTFGVRPEKFQDQSRVRLCKPCESPAEYIILITLCL